MLDKHIASLKPGEDPSDKEVQDRLRQAFAAHRALEEAGPDMLATLKDILEFWQNHENGKAQTSAMLSPSALISDGDICIYEKVKATIAKATDTAKHMDDY